MKTKFWAALATTTALAMPALAQGAIRIGVLTPLSGAYAGIGQQVRWRLDLAAEEINAAGGVMGRPIELIYEDSEANPATAVPRAERLFAYLAAAEAAGSVETDALREGFHDLSWNTPQGTKTIRGGDHQAMQQMHVVRVENGEFRIIGGVSAEDAFGDDRCERF